MAATKKERTSTPARLNADRVSHRVVAEVERPPCGRRIQPGVGTGRIASVRLAISGFAARVGYTYDRLLGQEAEPGEDAERFRWYTRIRPSRTHWRTILPGQPPRAGSFQGRSVACQAGTLGFPYQRLPAPPGAVVISRSPGGSRISTRFRMLTVSPVTHTFRDVARYPAQRQAVRSILNRLKDSGRTSKASSRILRAGSTGRYHLGSIDWEEP